MQTSPWNGRTKWPVHPQAREEDIQRVFVTKAGSGFGPWNAHLAKVSQNNISNGIEIKSKSSFAIPSKGTRDVQQKQGDKLQLKKNVFSC